MRLTITIDLDEAVGRIETSVKQLHTKVDAIMVTEKNVETLLDEINVATNNVAAKIDREQKEIAALKAGIEAGTPVSQAQLDAIGTRLGTLKTTLEGIAADPAVPVPPTVDNPPVPGTVG